METATSSAATLTQPRLAFITAGALFCVSLYVLHQSIYGPPPPGVHRSNATRRPHRRARNRGVSSAAIEASLDRGNGGAVSPSTDASHDDENADLRDAHPSADGETAANDEQTIEDDWNEHWGLPPPRAGQNIVGLLFRVSEDNARRNAYVHRGCMCNACGMVPIRGIRYRCANCSDFDLCETCESQGLHNKTHVFFKIKIPAPPFGPKSMQPVWYPGDPDNCLRNLPRGLMSKLSENTGFERPELEAFWEQWTFIANFEWREDPDELNVAMDRKTFERCLVPSGGHRRAAPNLIHDRMFAFYDTNNDGMISFREFLYGLSYRKRKDKFRRIFNGYDIDGDGLVSRRDFLRIFRAYYVLYKHMHRDILEGLDVQVMNTTETQQLVTSRAPLSSLFGREGRVPEADHGRPMEGKIFHGNGDVVVQDDKNRVVNEDSADTGDRGDILSTLFNRRGGDDIFGENAFSPRSEHVQSPNGDAVSHIYHDALLDPPTRVDELPQLLVGQPRHILPIGMIPPSDEQPRQNGHESASSDGEESSDDDGEAAEDDPTIEDAAEEEEEENPAAQRGEEQYPAAYIPGRPAGDERWTNRVPTDSQLRARLEANLLAHKQRQAMNRKVRVAARKKLLERWKKRQFYLDEEEGAQPPDGWDSGDDVLEGINGAGESSKAEQPPMSARSRSSSKVRFAEDTDDYEIRSNPSTSSRSVPERWGGMDIPDAERDVGKEILYTVTQQSFNELLDVLFKKKEDIAIRAAETREDRRLYRHKFDSIDLSKEDQAQQSQGWSVPVTSIPESTRWQNKTLDELLALSGYTVDQSAVDAAGAEKAAGAESEEAEESEEEEVTRAEETAQSSTTLEDTRDSTPPRDPTMPQFRPNSDADLQESSIPTRDYVRRSSLAGDVSYQPTEMPYQTTKMPSGYRTKSVDFLQPLAENSIPRSTLVEWKKLDVAEEEARKRGGWGKLNFEEFEEIWKKEEHGPHRLEYLGTWIDFCIP